MKHAPRMLDCLAAAYRLDLDGEAYVRNIAEVSTPLLDRGLGVVVYTYDARDPQHPAIDHFATAGAFDPGWLPGFYAAVEADGIEPGSPSHPTGFANWAHLSCGQASRIPGLKPLLRAFRYIGGSRDSFAVNAVDASRRGLWIGAPLRTTRRVAAPEVELFTRFAAHLASAIRLRRTAAATNAAVMAPGGALLHASSDGVAKSRDELRHAALSFDRARTREGRGDVERATRRWRPLVASQWTLLDEFDSDGRRFVVARDNAPPTRAPRGTLSVREHQVLTQAHLGHTNKVIAYELGLSAATVRVLLHRAAKKLGATTRAEAIARFAKRVPDGR